MISSEHVHPSRRVPHTADLIQTLSTWVSTHYSHNGPPKKRKQVQQPGCTMSWPRWAKNSAEVKDTRPDSFQAAGCSVGCLVPFCCWWFRIRIKILRKLQKMCASIYHLHPFTLKNDSKMCLISHVDTKFRAPSFFLLVRIIVSVSSSISKHLGRN